MAQAAQETHKPIAWVVNHSRDAARAIKSVFFALSVASRVRLIRRGREVGRETTGASLLLEINKSNAGSRNKQNKHSEHCRMIYISTNDAFVLQP